MTDETVVEEAKELRQLAGNYLMNERFLIGHTRRKALLQARKKMELARPYQTVKWAERELEKIDAAIPIRGLDAQAKEMPVGDAQEKGRGRSRTGRIDRRYDPDWATLEALDKKAEALRKESPYCCLGWTHTKRPWISVSGAPRSAMSSPPELDSRTLIQHTVKHRHSPRKRRLLNRARARV